MPTTEPLYNILDEEDAFWNEQGVFVLFVSMTT